MNEDGKHQDMAQQTEHERELIEQLNLLKALDHRNTPEHVAQRFRELWEATGDDGSAPDENASVVRAAHDEAAAIIVNGQDEAERPAVEVELDRLIQENEELRAKLAESLRGGRVPMSALSSPVADPAPEMMAPEPPMMGMPLAEDSVDRVARVLVLAQQTADQAIADARREADETLGRARREAEEILGKSRRHAEQITSDARACAESLERDAQERHRQAMGSLVQQREELERRIDDLRAFEREYRSRLKAYLEGQMRDLEAGATDSGAFPAMGSGPDSSLSSGLSRLEARNGQASIDDAYAGEPEPVLYVGFHPSDGWPADHR